MPKINDKTGAYKNALLLDLTEIMVLLHTQLNKKQTLLLLHHTILPAVTNTPPTQTSQHTSHTKTYILPHKHPNTPHIQKPTHLPHEHHNTYIHFLDKNYILFNKHTTPQVDTLRGADAHSLEEKIIKWNTSDTDAEGSGVKGQVGDVFACLSR